MKRLLYILACLFFFSTILAVGTTVASNGLVIESIEVTAGDDKLEKVVFKLNGSHTPKSFRINGDNPRVVFDFFGVKYPSAINRIDDVGGNIISGIRIGRHNEPPKTRVVVDIQKDSPFLHEQTFNVSNNSLVVTFTPDYTETASEDSIDQPPRIEVGTAKIVHSGSQTRPEIDPPDTDKEETGQGQDMAVEIVATPSEEVQESVTPSPEVKSDAPTAPSPPIQPSKPGGFDQQEQTTKPDQPDEQPAIAEQEPEKQQGTPVEIAATPPEKVKESASPSSEAKKDTPSPPSPTAQPDEPSDTDQQAQTIEQEQSAEPPVESSETDVPSPSETIEALFRETIMEMGKQPATDEEEDAQRQDTPVEIAATPPEKDQESTTTSPDAETETPPTPSPPEAPASTDPSPPVQPSETGGEDQQTQVAKTTPSPDQQSTEAADIVPVLLDVSFEKSINESETVLFRLNHFYPPLVFGIEKGEPRVVCDFFDAEIDENIPPEIEAGGQFVDRIMVTEEADPDKVRVELVLMPNRNYDLQQLFFKEDNLFVVIVKELQEDSATAN